eukprot:TRINITY_DN21608_c0_g1_i1.p1 TRINITY_DN21608_c0_g1~~TRINITY_DN21608_c0_g1_i1.p1  ORF type:complete len:360 (-),score=62.90 TRINITY_DN21608_c0_g1_i1:42-971(-)
MPAPVTWILRQFFGRGTVAGVQRPVLNLLAKFSDAPPGNRSSSIQEPIRKFMEKEQTWGENCVKITDHARGGFCKFKQEHLFAAHSFGIHALAQTQQLTTKSSQLPLLQLIMSERDGITRNGLSYAAAQHYHEVAQRLKKSGGGDYSKADASACMYRFSNGTRSEDSAQWGLDHVMPHANLASCDTPGAERWWQDKLFKNIVGFLSGEKNRLSDVNITGDKNECVDIPLARNALNSKATSWIKAVLSPEVAPKNERELTPDRFWNATVLNFDFWARYVGCPLMKSSLKGVVDCSAFARSVDPSEKQPSM